MYNGKRIVYECLGAPRKQNSYNSGVWLDYVGQTVENQEVMWLPTNDDTKTIQYDTKFLKSSPGRYPALKWTTTKIEDSAVDGISMFTMAQTQFDPDKDNCDLMIADYWESAVEPEQNETQIQSNLEIVYSGAPAVRAGGGYKKFALKQYVDGELEDISEEIEWVVENTVVDVTSDDVFSIHFGNHENGLMCLVQENVIKVKCINDYSLIGSTFTITAKNKDGPKSVIVEVTSL